MSRLTKRIVAGSFAAAMLAAGAAPAFAFDAVIPPNPAARLGNYGPYGHRASPHCTWSRIQVPTASGLRWVAVRSCDGSGAP